MSDELAAALARIATAENHTKHLEVENAWLLAALEAVYRAQIGGHMDDYEPVKDFICRILEEASAQKVHILHKNPLVRGNEGKEEG